MPLTPFATHTDLALRLGTVLAAGEQSRADTLLSQASDLVRQAARQDITKVTNDILTMRGIDSSTLRLPQKPIVSITSITHKVEGGSPVTVAASEYYLDREYLLRKSYDGWYGPEEELVITYTHGYDTIPQLVKSITLEAVVRCWINPGAVSSETHGSEGAQFGAEHRGLLLTDKEELQLIHTFGPGRIRSVEFS